MSIKRSESEQARDMLIAMKQSRPDFDWELYDSLHAVAELELIRERLEEDILLAKTQSRYYDMTEVSDTSSDGSSLSNLSNDDVFNVTDK